MLKVLTVWKNPEALKFSADRLADWGHVLKDYIQAMSVLNWKNNGPSHWVQLCCLNPCLNILGLVAVKKAHWKLVGSYNGRTHTHNKRINTYYKYTYTGREIGLKSNWDPHTSWLRAGYRGNVVSGWSAETIGIFPLKGPLMNLKDWLQRCWSLKPLSPSFQWPNSTSQKAQRTASFQFV